jgi:hypothetical protein
MSSLEVAFGWRPHSGWAALVVLGRRDGEIAVVDRRRVELVEKEWEKQPYHAAEDLEPKAARSLVERGIATAHRIASREMRAAVTREMERGNRVVASAVLVGGAMPPWSIEEILAVHFRMHQAEGVLFRDVLVRAANDCSLGSIELVEKSLMKVAPKKLHASAAVLERKIATLGRSAGPPWGKDQKLAALAALVGLSSAGGGK